jgi:hypothetical protein
VCFSFNSCARLPCRVSSCANFGQCSRSTPANALIRHRLRSFICTLRNWQNLRWKNLFTCIDRPFIVIKKKNHTAQPDSKGVGLYGGSTSTVGETKCRSTTLCRARYVPTCRGQTVDDRAEHLMSASQSPRFIAKLNSCQS